MTQPRVWCWPVALALVACGGDDDRPADGGPDGGVATFDGGPDGGVATFDGGTTDGGIPAIDAPTSDGGPPADAGSCTPGAPDTCSGPLECLCCPAGGPAQNCLCTTACTTPGDCRGERPICNQEIPGASTGLCTPSGFMCAWGAV